MFCRHVGAVENLQLRNLASWTPSHSSSTITDLRTVPYCTYDGLEPTQLQVQPDAAAWLHLPVDTRTLSGALAWLQPNQLSFMLNHRH